MSQARAVLTLLKDTGLCMDRKQIYDALRQRGLFTYPGTRAEHLNRISRAASSLVRAGTLCMKGTGFVLVSS